MTKKTVQPNNRIELNRDEDCFKQLDMFVSKEVRDKLFWENGYVFLEIYEEEGKVYAEVGWQSYGQNRNSNRDRVVVYRGIQTNYQLDALTMYGFATQGTTGCISKVIPNKRISVNKVSMFLLEKERCPWGTVQQLFEEVFENLNKN